MYKLLHPLCQNVFGRSFVRFVRLACRKEKEIVEPVTVFHFAKKTKLMMRSCVRAFAMALVIFIWKTRLCEMREDDTKAQI